MDNDIAQLRVALADKLVNNQYNYKIPTWISAIIDDVFNSFVEGIQPVLFTVEEENIIESMPACTRCEIRTNNNSPVPPQGELRHYDIMIVGEAPGEEEVKQGKPFVGPAGQFLDKMLDKIGWKREDIFITNTINCRPPDNRTPHVGEVANCSNYLLPFLEIVRPKIIICLGSVAANALIHPDFKITKDHGVFHHLADLEWQPQAVALYHPAYLLRNDDAAGIQLRVDVWNELQSIDKFLKEGVIPAQES